MAKKESEVAEKALKASVESWTDVGLVFENFRWGGKPNEFGANHAADPDLRDIFERARQDATCQRTGKNDPKLHMDLFYDSVRRDRPGLLRDAFSQLHFGGAQIDDGVLAAVARFYRFTAISTIGAHGV